MRDDILRVDSSSGMAQQDVRGNFILVTTPLVCTGPVKELSQSRLNYRPMLVWADHNGAPQWTSCEKDPLQWRAFQLADTDWERVKDAQDILKVR